MQSFAYAALANNPWTAFVRARAVKGLQRMAWPSLATFERSGSLPVVVKQNWDLRLVGWKTIDEVTAARLWQGKAYQQQHDLGRVARVNFQALNISDGHRNPKSRAM